MEFLRVILKNCMKRHLNQYISPKNAQFIRFTTYEGNKCSISRIFLLFFITLVDFSIRSPHDLSPSDKREKASNKSRDIGSHFTPEPFLTGNTAITFHCRESSVRSRKGRLSYAKAFFGMRHLACLCSLA